MNGLKNISLENRRRRNKTKKNTISLSSCTILIFTIETKFDIPNWTLDFSKYCNEINILGLK